MLSGNVLITGGSGTLGKAILTLAQRENWPARFTIYSRSELLQAQMRVRFPQCRYVIGDVRDYSRLEAAIAGHDTVIHAAAMKRIPECEQQPQECWQTNVIGTANVIRACIAQGVERCIGISTDKAVRATTAYGASKLMLEKMFRAAPERCQFTVVRYGNVVASRGSVIPIWREQAAQGKPLTLTNKGMTRFWMSPFEAAWLVSIGLNKLHGTVLVRRMGALSLEEMAHIIAPNSKIVEIGLRSEEKQHEDLVHPDEQADQLGDYFLVGDGTLGWHYSSDTAWRLTPDQFLRMLAEAEELE